MTALQDQHVLIFTGGIGAISAGIRHQICSHLEWPGINLNPAANYRQALKISSIMPRIDIFSLKTDEALVMAR